MIAAGLRWLDRLIAMTGKEFKQLFRDPILLAVLLYFFSADIYLAANGIHMDLRQASLMVLDRDRSATSRELIQRFQMPYFDLRGELFDAHQAQTLLDRGEVLAVLSVPPQFQRDLQAGLPVAVQFRVDASNAILGTLAISYAEEILARFSQEQALERLGGSIQLQAVPRIEDLHRVYYNPNQNNPWFMSISELLTITTMLSLMLPAAAAVREKERGTIEQLVVTPLSPLQILLPKILSMGIVIVSGVAASLFLVIEPAFQLPIRGSLSLFFLVTALYVFATAGLGLFIASLSRTFGQVVMLVILLMMPLLLLSGAWTPPEAMPDFLRHAMIFSPLSHYIELAYGILLKGAGLAVLWDSLLGLALLGSLLFSFGLWHFRRQFD